MTTTVGTFTQQVDVFVRPARTGLSRFRRIRGWRVGTTELHIPAAATCDQHGDVHLTAPTALPVVMRALGDALRVLADEAHRVAIEETPDEL